MSTIAITNIQLAPNRQRSTFAPDRLNELRESIEARGLFHPIVLREERGQFFLVAGERRLRAVSELYDLGGTFTHDNDPVPAGHIPYVSLGELSVLDREEAELEENIRREDLTWQERASATARLAELRRKQGEAGLIPPPTTSSLAEEIRGSGVGHAREATRREMIVAAHLDKPEVAAAKTVDDAFKILKREESLTKNRELAATVGKTFTAESHRLHHKDATEWLLECPSGAYDVILTDPPYGMSADQFGDAGGCATAGHDYGDTQEVFERCVAALVSQSMRITKPTAHLYCFCDLEKFSILRETFQLAGWEVHRTPLIWHKPNGNRVPWPQYGPRRQYELILYAVKGKRPVNLIGSDILTFPSDKNLGNSAQKPVALLSELLKRSCRPGDTVLDPFCGTGSIFPAAHAAKILATGVEIDPASYGIAAGRLQAIAAQLELPL